MWEATKCNSDTVVTSDSDSEAAEPPTKRTKNSQEIILTPTVPENNPNELPGNDVGDKNEGGGMLATENNPNEPPGDDVGDKNEGGGMLVTENNPNEPPGDDVGDKNIEEKLVTDVNQKLVTDVGGQQSPVVEFQPIQSGTRMEPNLKERFVFQKYHEII